VASVLGVKHGKGDTQKKIRKDRGGRGGGYRKRKATPGAAEVDWETSTRTKKSSKFPQSLGRGGTGPWGMGKTRQSTHRSAGFGAHYRLERKAGWGTLVEGRCGAGGTQRKNMEEDCHGHEAGKRGRKKKSCVGTNKSRVWTGGELSKKTKR